MIHLLIIRRSDDQRAEIGLYGWLLKTTLLGTYLDEPAPPRGLTGGGMMAVL